VALGIFDLRERPDATTRGVLSSAAIGIEHPESRVRRY
jgi:hypothetical protein